MYEQSVLDNGLKVISNRLSGRESIGLAIWVKVGGRYESKALSGVSHFTEHMLFKGTKNRTTKQIKEDIEGVGGMLNAFTSEESTCYFVKIPKNQFEHAYDVLQDMVNEATLSVQEFQKERTVILEEIKMYLDLPSQHVHEMMSELLWPDQPLGRPIAGTSKTVSGMNRKHLYEHVKLYYHPKNILITASGDFDHQQFKDLSLRHFSRIYPKSLSKFVPVKRTLKSRNDRHKFLNKKTEQTHFVIAFHGLSRNHADRYKLGIMNVILGGNMSSRLFEQVREQRGLAYEIKSGLGFFHDSGSISISAGVEPKKAPLAVKIIMKELGRLKRSYVSKNELRRAKDYYLGQFLLGLEDTLDNALWYGERILYGGDLPDVSRIRSEIEKVTEEDIQNISRKFFKNSDTHLALIGPTDTKYESQINAECQCP